MKRKTRGESTERFKTQRQLEDEWGPRRFTSALVALAGWYIEHGIPDTRESIKALLDSNSDAFEVFVARTLDERDELEREIKAVLMNV